MLKFVFAFLCSFTVIPVWAQTLSLGVECQEAVRSGENFRNPDIYSACGFDDRQKAFGEWALWAEREKAGQALYEICIRHSGTYQAESYCQKAIKLGNGPALLRYANTLYNKGNYTEAATAYTAALSSPLLTEAEKGQISQNLGLLYMNPESRYYNPAKGLPLIKRSVERRGAEANNLMGVYSLFGMETVPQSAEESFKYFWRAVLLGCPAAEENLGLWYLAKQRKVNNKTVLSEMKKRMFSCVAPEFTAPAELQKNDCNCEEVVERERLAARYPYRLTEISEDRKKATLLDKDKQEISAEINTVLSNGMKVSEIRKKAVFLTTPGKRVVLNLAPVDNCSDLCQQKKDNVEKMAKTIKPYHLTFTPKECSDILYYAERLVDTSQPFTGKTECQFSADMDKASDLLMNL